mmetsp:Transcript_70383/g.153430  ORF Transcript_70383/g.153430 Transcript_70383/m.153430 type:complete len:306 (+) Transcript_70383:47-964(+)
MLKFTIVAPDKQKVELEMDGSATFQEVKSKVESKLGVPCDKQRILCNGKERKNGAETLTAAGLKPNSKLMLMLVPGYSMPPPPASSETADVPMPDASKEQAPAPKFIPRSLEGELTSAAAVEGSSTAPDVVPGVINIRQSSHRYVVKVPSGLQSVTFGQLAEYMSANMLPDGVPASEFRFICKGKSPESTAPLAAAGTKEISIMLLFREGFHLAEEGADWLRHYKAELEDAEAKIEKIAKRVEANFADAETSLKLGEVAGLVETLKQSVESVRVRETQLDELKKFQERVLAADEKLEALRKSIRL